MDHVARGFDGIHSCLRRLVLCALLIANCQLLIAASIDYQEINADKVIYNPKSGEMKTSGQTEIISKTGQKMTLADAYVFQNKAAGKGISVEWDNHTLMTAKTLDKNGDMTVAKSVTYTACHKCDEAGTAWTVHATDMTHDAVAKDMHFYNFWFDIYGLPVLYLPYLSQPDPTVKYRSGLLLPDFGSTTNMGTQLDIPLYLNFSNSHDLTVTGSILTLENPMLSAKHRLILDHANFETSGSFTRSRNSDMNRWHLFHNDTIDLGENMRLSVWFQRTSDNTYLQQYEFYSSQPFLESNAKLEMFAEHGYMTVEAGIFQELRKKIYAADTVPKGDILPKVHGVYQIGLTKNLYSQFTGDAMRIVGNNNDFSLDRLIGEARVIAPIETAWQRFTLSAAVRNDYYQYDNIAKMQMAQGKSVVENANRLLPSGYVDWEMPFVKNGEDWTQIIRPKARVTVMGKSNSRDFLNMDSTGALLSDVSLFTNNRYSGYDLWVNGTYADYGMSWTGYNSAGQSAEVFVGQTYDFDADSDPDINSGYHRGASDIVGRIGASPVSWLSVTNRFRVEKNELNLRHLESDARIGGRNYISFGYIWAVQFSAAHDAYVRNADVSEGVVGVGLHLTGRLNLRGRGVYNFTDRIVQRYNAGLYYDHPCYTLAMIYNVDNARKHAVGNSGLDFIGVSSLKFKFAIKMGK